MTAKEHSVFYRITFPRNETNLESDNPSALPYRPIILFDLTDLPESRTYGSMSVLERSDGTVQFSGNGTFRPSFGLGSFNVSGFIFPVPRSLWNFKTDSSRETVSIVLDTRYYSNTH